MMPVDLVPAAGVPPAPRRLVVYVAAFVAVGGLAVVVGALRLARAASERDERVARVADVEKGITVVVAPVADAPGTDPLTVTAEVHALREAAIYPRLDGYLREVRVDKGDTVDAGALLATVDAPDAEYQLHAKRAELALKEKVAKRTKVLAGTGLASQQDVERTGVELRVAQFDYARLRAMRGFEEIRAPFNGVVNARHVDPGVFVTAPAGGTSDAAPLLEISDASRVRIRAYLGQADAARVKRGDAVTVWRDDEDVQARALTITRSSEALDPKTRTMLVEVEAPNGEGYFRPGSFVHVKLALRADPSVSVPIEAITLRGGAPQVAIVSHGRARFVGVTLGKTDGRSVRVLSGVSAGEWVALFAGDELVDAANVRPVLANGQRPPPDVEAKP